MHAHSPTLPPPSAPSPPKKQQNEPHSVFLVQMMMTKLSPRCNLTYSFIFALLSIYMGRVFCQDVDCDALAAKGKCHSDVEYVSNTYFLSPHSFQYI